MKFAAGFQYRNQGELFSDMLPDYRPQLAEVYFSYPGFASGRPERSTCLPDALEQIEYELHKIRTMGIKLDLLINGNCYGPGAVSERFYREIAQLMERLNSVSLLPEIVTTTSPFAAHSLRKLAPDIEIRASVNMRIDSTTALDYLLEKFDSFYLRRDLQRDLDTVKHFAKWSEKHGKKMCLLANSGCLRNCPYQTFHDNLVAHDAELREMRNCRDFIAHLCWERYSQGGNLEDFLRSSWLRPEDVKYYEPYCGVMKLATRQHTNPRMILGAYCSGNFDGNLLDLTEPCYAEKFAPKILDNRSLDGVELPGSCGSNCINCGKCREILEKSVIIKAC